MPSARPSPQARQAAADIRAIIAGMKAEGVDPNAAVADATDIYVAGLTVGYFGERKDVTSGPESE